MEFNWQPSKCVGNVSLKAHRKRGPKNWFWCNSHTQFGRWSLKYGPGILGMAGGLTGLIINQHYRARLRLGAFGAFSTYLPIVALPTMVATLYHKVVSSNVQLVSNQNVKMLLRFVSVCTTGNRPEKAGLSSMSSGKSGFVSSCVRCCISCHFITSCRVHGEKKDFFLKLNYWIKSDLVVHFQFAVRHFTYRLPSISKPKELFAVYKKMTRPLSMTFSVALALHVLLAMALTQKETSDFYRLEQQAMNEELLT